MILKRLLLFCFFALPFTGFAQITVTDGDILGLIGTTNTFEFNGLESVMVDVGSASDQSQTWDFRSLELGSFLGDIDFVSPAGTPFENDFPGANFVQRIAYTQDTLSFAIYNYMVVTASNIGRLGSGTLLNDTPGEFRATEDLGPLPVSFGDQWQSTRQDTFSLVPGFSTITTDTTENYIDAFGTVKLPFGDFECLRMRSVSKTITTQIAGGIPLPATTTITTSYIWLDKNHFFITSISVAEGGGASLAKTSGVVEADAVIRLADMSTGIAENAAAWPEGFALNQNYPNPFNPETVIKFQMPAAMSVELTISNLLGQHVRTLVSGTRSSGDHEVRWNGMDDQGLKVPSGIYIYQLRAGDIRQTRRMLLMR